jgi:hypothetical protein
MQRIIRFNEAAEPANFRVVLPQDAPELPVRSTTHVRDFQNKDGSVFNIRTCQPTVPCYPETLSWGRCRRIIGEVIAKLRSSDLSGAANVTVYFVDDSMRRRCVDGRCDYIKVEKLDWNETGGTKGDRILDAAAARMAGRDIFHITIQLESGHSRPLVVRITPLADDYVHLVWIENFVSRHFICDDAMGGTEEAISSCGIVPQSN